MKCYGFAVFWNFRILKVVLDYRKWSKTNENEDSQRKFVELSNDMSDVFLTFLEMKCDTTYHGLHNHGELVDSCEGSSLSKPIKWSLNYIKWLLLVEVLTFRDFVVISWVTSYWDILKWDLSDHLIRLLK